MHLATCTSKSLTYLLIKQHVFYLFEIFKPYLSIQLLELDGFFFNKKKKIYVSKGVSFGNAAILLRKTYLATKQKSCRLNERQ